MRVCAVCRMVLGEDAGRCAADGAATEPVEILPSGARIGAYRIERLIGEGGMGFVYEVTHEVLHRRSAIKLLRPELAIHPHIVTRFLNEAKAVNLIDHPNIVNIYDYGDGLTGCVYFVMELLEGETLDDMMEQHRTLPLPLLLHVFGQIAKALAAAHARQIVHRDLKPANVYLVTRETNPYFVKLLDFGVAQLRGAGATRGFTAAGSILGTPQYMSPEQISGGPVDARSDVWAMGVMLYRAATGCAPFPGDQFAEVADRILHHASRRASDITALPPALAELIESCLERRVEARCPSIGELIDGLERVKQACRLDDGAILAAVGAPRVASAPPRDLAHGEVIGAPVHDTSIEDGGREPGLRAMVSRLRSWLGVYAAAGAIAVALGAMADVVVHRGDQAAAAGERGSVAAPAGPAVGRSVEDAIAAGDAGAARAIAERELRGAIASGPPQQERAVEAIALTHAAAGAPLLAMALDGPPDVQVKAAGALGELGLAPAVPRLRVALQASGDKIRVEIAAALYRLSDRSVRTILLSALHEPTTRLVAATALAESWDDAGRPVLVEILETIPAGREQWRRAAGALLNLGDGHARARLQNELAQPDAVRSVGAAALLARAGDARARQRLAEDVADAAFPRRGDAAAALARLGDARALGWVGQGIGSLDAEQRKLALAVCGLLAACAAHAREVARLATQDPDLGVRMAAEAVVLGW